MRNKEPIFSLSRKDFRVDTFRVPGNGGQKVNKTESGVRITHIASGISAQSVESRMQGENKNIAFKKLCSNKMFKLWIKNKAFNKVSIEEEVDRTMIKSNLKEEMLQGAKWVPLVENEISKKVSEDVEKFLAEKAKAEELSKNCKMRFK